jgi:hypothetical protein
VSGFVGFVFRGPAGARGGWFVLLIKRKLLKLRKYRVKTCWLLSAVLARATIFSYVRFSRGSRIGFSYDPPAGCQAFEYEPNMRAYSWQSLQAVLLALIGRPHLQR